MQSADEKPAPSVGSEVSADAAPSQQAPVHDEPLMDEVQSFLHRRAELAKKLADEIEATEQKLAELRKTAAMLFPENAAGAPKDRKPKKVKKAPSREEKAEPAAAPDNSPPAEATE